jgi:indole-3-glycerol phosphate synthase
MSSILEQIFAAKKIALAERQRDKPLANIKAEASAAPPPRDFVGALTQAQPAIIAEIKRASPSKGDILPTLDPVEVAREYVAGGAAAISVLTDSHFKGSLEDLRAVRAAITLPVLRKDFIFDIYQIYESRAAGADAILLIAAMLNDRDLGFLADAAHELGMAALVEAHTMEELARAESTGARLIGINNRNLHTFVTDIAITAQLLCARRTQALVVSESGIETSADLRRAYRAGARAALIGESLLKDGRPRERLRALIKAFERGN